MFCIETMKKLSIYDLWALFLIGLLTYFSLPYWYNRFPLFCEFYDIFYHLSISNTFFLSGGMDKQYFFWDALHKTNLHLYPPFLHFVQLALLASGISKFAIANYMTWFLYPVSFLSLWLFMRNVFSGRAGFYAVLLLSVPAVWLEKMWGYQANALLLIITPLALWAMSSRRYFIAVILVLICLITNVSGVFVALTLIIYAFLRPKENKFMLWLFLVIAIIAVPIILVTFKRIYEYHFLAKSLSFSPLAITKIISPHQYYGFLGVTGVAGFILCFLLKENYFILTAYFLANLPPLLLNYEYRFWLNILLPLVMLSAVALSKLHEKITRLKKGYLYGTFFFITVILLSNILFTESAPFLEKEKQSALMTMAFPRLWTKYQLLVTQEEKLELVEAIKNNSAKYETFFVDSNENVIKMLSALSDRFWSTDIEAGNRIIIVKEPKSGLNIIKKIGIFYVYKQTDESKIKKIIIPKPLITIALLKTIFLIIGLLILIDIFNLPNMIARNLYCKKS